MKIIFILTLCFFISHSQADFLSAQNDYNDGNFEKAYKEYLTLAKFGNNKAQYNLAVMFVKGQGVEIDLPQAYAWSKVSESNPEYKALTNTIEKSLSNDQLINANKIYEEYFTQYSFENSKIILGPIAESQDIIISKEETEVSEAIELVIEKTFAPNYPKDLAKKRVQGWVEVHFKIYPDGSARDFYITKEIPAKGFGIEALKAIENYKFSFKKNGKKTLINEPILASQRIDFKFSNTASGISEQQQYYLNDLIDKAFEGDIDSQFTYAILYDSLLNKKGEIGGEQINDWLFNAAIDGITDAQYKLGLNIYQGNDCKIEKQKGLDWIMQAAQMGSSHAQYMAYAMLMSKDVINHSNSSPFYWLSQSAENGLTIAQLVFAKEVALMDLPTMDQISTAKKYLTHYAETIYKTTQWYQVNAMLLNKANKRSKALSSVKKALKSAKKAGWDLTELQQLKADISNKKS